MTVASFVETYGYLALLAGAFFEGEATVLIAGFMAHNGHLQLPWVMLIAAVGAFGSDQALYRIGRFEGMTVFRRLPHVEARMQRVKALLTRYQDPLMIGFRFVYGIRLVTVLAIGIAGLSAVRFALLNAIGVAAWAAVVSSIGYCFGHVLEQVHLLRYQALVALVLGAAGVGLWLWHHTGVLRAKSVPSATSQPD
jgi:membrane protein DedA with SNARE-associated domain